MRILFALSLLFALLLLPLWATALLALLGFFLFPHFWEAVALGLVIELLFHGEKTGLFGIGLPFFVLVFIVFALVEIARSFIREQRAW